MDIAILPLAVTMMAGPQEMTAVILVTARETVRLSTAFLVGVTAAMLLGTTITYLLAGALGDLGDPDDKGSAGLVIQYVLAAVLLFLAIRIYRNREHVEPPKWLGGLLEATPRKALTMGFLLILVFPTDVATMLTVGVNLQQNDAALLDAWPFWALTWLIAALPFLTFLLFRRRAEQAMPRVRDWLATNAWLVNIFVLGLFILMLLT